MIFRVEFDENQFQRYLEAALKTKTDEELSNAVGSWQTKEYIRNKTKETLESVVNTVLQARLVNLPHQVGELVDKAISELIKAKAKKAMK